MSRPADLSRGVGCRMKYLPVPRVAKAFCLWSRGYGLAVSRGDRLAVKRQHVASSVAGSSGHFETLGLSTCLRVDACLRVRNYCARQGSTRSASQSPRDPRGSARGARRLRTLQGSRERARRTRTLQSPGSARCATGAPA